MATITLRDLELTPVRWALGERTANARRAWTTRDVLLLRVRTEEGAVGWGEAAPLPGFSPDDLETCGRALRARATALGGLSFSSEAPFAKVIARATVDLASPAAVFAVESALLDVIAQVRGLPASAVLGTTRLTLPIAALLRATTGEAVAREARAAAARGIGFGKLKVGGEGSSGDEARLRALDGPRADTGLRLRLDANQSLDPNRIASELARYARFAPDLLEEPVGGRAWLAIRETPIPLAMDESLARPEAEDLVRACAARRTCSALVLKPMLHGVLRTFALARLAEELGLFVVVTHMFDGPVAAAATSEIALALPGDVRAAGLDAHGRAADWPVLCMPEQLGASQLRPGRRLGLGVDAMASDLVAVCSPDRGSFRS